MIEERTEAYQRFLNKEILHEPMVDEKAFASNYAMSSVKHLLTKRSNVI